VVKLTLLKLSIHKGFVQDVPSGLWFNLVNTDAILGTICEQFHMCAGIFIFVSLNLLLVDLGLLHNTQHRDLDM